MINGESEPAAHSSHPCLLPPVSPCARPLALTHAAVPPYAAPAALQGLLLLLLVPPPPPRRALAAGSHVSLHVAQHATEACAHCVVWVWGGGEDCRSADALGGEASPGGEAAIPRT